MTAHHRHTRRQSLGPNDRPSAAYTRTHRVEDGDTIGSSRAAQITAHSQRDDGNDDDDDHDKGPAAIKLLFQIHPLDGRPINPNNNQASIQQPPKENNPSRENRQTKCAVTKCYLIDRAHCSQLPTIKFLAQSTLVTAALKIIKNHPIPANTSTHAFPCGSVRQTHRVLPLATHPHTNQRKSAPCVQRNETKQQQPPLTTIAWKSPAAPTAKTHRFPPHHTTTHQPIHPSIESLPSCLLPNPKPVK